MLYTKKDYCSQNNNKIFEIFLIPKKVNQSCKKNYYYYNEKYDERKFVGKKGNHPLMLSIINLAIVNSTVKESFKVNNIII